VTGVRLRASATIRLPHDCAPMMKRVRRSRRAFTLVELLVVIGIIALLVAFLMPALRRVRLAAERAACLSNISQIGKSLFIYVSDHKGYLPPATNTVFNYGDPDATGTLIGAPNGGPSFLSAALGTTSSTAHSFYCPTSDQTEIGVLYGVSYMPTPLSDTTYMANGVVMSRNIGSIRHASEIILLHEFAYRMNAAIVRPLICTPSDTGGMQTYYRQPSNAYFIAWHWYAGNREGYNNTHDAGGNLIFADGHGEYRKYADLRSGDYGLTPDEIWTPGNADFPTAGGPYRSVLQ
jgi:prepilin-type N-terminal cleavage/methylation domain-containing protein